MPPKVNFFNFPNPRLQASINDMTQEISERVKHNRLCCFEVKNKDDSSIIYLGNDAVHKLSSELSKSVFRILNSGNNDAISGLHKISSSYNIGQCSWEELLCIIAELDKSGVGYKLTFSDREATPPPVTCGH